MEEAIFGIIGILVGGGITLLGTYLTLKQSTKMELRRLILANLIEKKRMIEHLFDICSFSYSGKMEEDQYNIAVDYKTISEFLYLKSHYFSDLDEFQKIETELNDIENDSHQGPQEIIYNQLDFNNKVHKFMKAELNKTMKRMNQQLEKYN